LPILEILLKFRYLTKTHIKQLTEDLFDEAFVGVTQK